VIDKVRLGTTKLLVSRISFGTTPLSGVSWKRESALSPEEGGRVLRRALELGINYWDSAEGYGSHLHIREALKGVERSNIVISTKTNAKEEYEVRKCIKTSLQELGSEYIDIYYLHRINSLKELRRKRKVIKALVKLREEGFIRHIGVSSHSHRVIDAVVELPEVEVIMAKINKIGYRTESPPQLMLNALSSAYDAGKGVVIMKVLAYGKLSIREALEWALRLPFVHTVCIGMRTIKEVEENVRLYHEIKEGTKS